MESSLTILSMRSIPGGVYITSPGLQIPALRDGKAETEGSDWRSMRSIQLEHSSNVTCQRGEHGTLRPKGRKNRISHGPVAVVASTKECIAGSGSWVPI